MKLVLFCDYGLDDAAATVDALLHAKQDGYEGVDLVAIGGNVPAEVSLRNAKKLAANVNCGYSKIRVVDTTAYSQPFEYLTQIHGGDGMGDLFSDCPAPCAVISFDEWRAECDPFVLVSLGPMTLVPYALEKKPAKFIFMGGNVAETPNFHGYEFNHGVNREAFSRCVKYPHVAVTMDTCRNPLFNVQDKAIGEKDLLHRIVSRSRALTFTSGEKGCYVWDDIAIKVLRHPERFALRRQTDRDGNLLTVAYYAWTESYLELIGK